MLKKLTLLLLTLSLISGSGFARTVSAEPVKSSIVEFTDPMIRKEVASALSDPENLFDGSKAISKADAATYEPTEDDMKNIKKLSIGPLFDADFNPVNATGIKGVEKAVNVEYLHLSSLHAPDLSLIGDLREVKDLYLKSNDLSDLSLIKNMKKITKLNVAGNDLKDLNGIEDLPLLESLTAGDNDISDISSLSSLTGLKALYLDDNRISDISPVKDLTGLKVLILNGNLIKSIENIGEKPDLVSLEINGTYTGPFEAPDESGNVLYDISPLSGMKSLESLYLQDTVHISDLSPLSGLTSLKTLVLRGNDIKDVSPLSGLTELTTLYLYKNHVEDISPLGSMTKMREFNFAVNNVKDISVVRSMPELNDIKGYMNDIDDLSPLKDIKAETVSFTHNHILDLSFLKNIGESGTAGFYVLDRQEKNVAADIISETRKDDRIEFTIDNPVILADGSRVNIDGNTLLDPSLGDDFVVGNAVELYNNTVAENNKKDIKVSSNGTEIKISMPSGSYEPGMTVNVPFLRLGALVSDDFPFDLYGSFTGTVHFTLGSKEVPEPLYTLTIKKIDSKTSEALEGAEFSLTSENGEEAGKGVTGKDGILTFSDLSRGRYTIRETKSPDGYILPKEGTYVEIDGKEEISSVTIENSKKAAPAEDPEKPEPQPEKADTPPADNKPEKLPDTGSESNNMLLISGLLLLVSVSLYLSKSRKTN